MCLIQQMIDAVLSIFINQEDNIACLSILIAETMRQSTIGLVLCQYKTLY